MESARCSNRPPIDPPVCRQGVTHKAATARFAITCAAFLPRLLSASPLASFLARPARVEINVITNRRMSGVSPVLRADSINDPVQSVIRKQIMPPHAAPPVVAARKRPHQQSKADAEHQLLQPAMRFWRPKGTATNNEYALSPTSDVPTTTTSTRDCNRSRASGIAFLHPVSSATPCISSPIAQPHPSQ